MNSLAPTIVIPARVTESFVNAHPELIFVYGNDYMERGCFGQSAHLGGTGEYRKKNTFRVPTSYKYCSNPVLFSDASYEENIRLIDDAIQQFSADIRPVIVLNKIGEGASNLKLLAPRTFKYLKSRLSEVCYKNIVWNYTPDFS
jgi:hypothetical protein